MELSIIVMWCMTSASQWKFPATQSVLYTCRSGWLELAEAGENRFNRVLSLHGIKGNRVA